MTRATIFKSCSVLSTCCCLLTSLHDVPAAEVEVDHALFRAVRNRDGQRVDRLLRQGTPVNIRSADGTTPLMIAALHGTAECMQMLLERGAHVNAANDRGVTPLLWGSWDLRKAQLLIAHGADVNAPSSLGNTPLMVAAARPGGSAIVELLVGRGADVTARNSRGVSALVKAADAGDGKSVQILLSHAEQTEQLETLLANDGARLLESAAIAADVDTTVLLCECLTKVNQGKLPDTGRALNAAMLAQRPDVACALLERGANTERLRQPGNVPSIVLAAYTETGDTSVLRALLKHGVNVEATNKYDESALTWARRRGHPDLIAMLVDAGTPERPDEMPQIPRRNINFHAGNQQRLLKDAVHRSLALLQHSSDVFLQERKTCVSCHHHNLPAVAIGWARDRGLAVDESSILRMVQRQTGLTAGRQNFVDRCFQLDDPAPVPPRLLGYGLWGLSALGYHPEDEGEAAVWYLASQQQPDGRWISGIMRPPMGGSDFTGTVLAMQALQLYPIAARAEEFRERIQRAAEWLQTTPTRYHQERALQLLGLGWAGRSTEQLAELVAGLLREQRADGGWSQLPNLPSDAWATGQTLVALHVAGGLPTTDPAFQRGLRFLLNTQFDDGSWFVKSRTWPFQPPFESGFPHGRDQWVSAPATAWAVMAMTLAITPGEAIVPILGDPLPQRTRRSQEDPNVDSSPAALIEVDFVRDIKPLIERSCVGCHSGDEPAGVLSMTERAPLLAGGETGAAAIVPGSSDESLMFIAASGSNDELHMPPLDKRDTFPPLSADQLAQLKRWIDSGAPWAAGVEINVPAYPKEP